MIAIGIDPSWEEVVNNIRQSAEESIGFKKLNTKKPWITNKIMRLNQIPQQKQTKED